MRVSLFVEHPVPRPWDADSEKRVLLESLEQMELADRAGFSGVWVTEHHFQEEYSHSSAPELFLAALSRRTTRLRLGHGIVQLPPAINHPVRVAERIGALDLLSDGRVQFGTGEASSMAEIDGFRFDPGKKRAMWRESLEVALRAMTEEPFTGHEGEFVSVPPRNVVPKPQQRPHPPVWVACTRPATIELAARMGIGALSFSYTGPEGSRPLVDGYYAVLADEAVPLTPTVNPNVLVTAGDLMVAPTHEEAVDRIGLGIGFHGYGIRHYYVSGRHRPGRTSVWDEYTRSLAGEDTLDAGLEAQSAATADRADWQRLALANARRTSDAHAGVGSPEEVRERMREYERAGVDELMFLVPPARHEHLMESIEVLGSQVLPEFAERDERAARAKAERLEPVVEKILQRRRRLGTELDPEYWFGGVPKAWTDGAESSEVRDAMNTAAALRENGKGEEQP
ncbi:monooxygenase [Streptomyces sp. MNU77]|uniref:LLM class flavin-dependent oxidoreductase n=1 Tax=Streptomyces sp. MNU77 TaxID=1573406 RepID=UPI00063FD714|nr:LLM class flavin-dependent oxidoreductase [Streptomyces sp. MNU77]OLO25805.1 monooxygenase [Streptomyces sp. MNU77]